MLNKFKLNDLVKVIGKHRHGEIGKVSGRGITLFGEPLIMVKLKHTDTYVKENDLIKINHLKSFL